MKFGNVSAIVLAAGEATRFNYGKPASFQKVLQKVHGKPMIDYTVALLERLNLAQIILVIGHKGEDVKKHLGPKFDYVVQRRRLGTLNAAFFGLKKVKKESKLVLVINGDDSFRYKDKTISNLFKKHDEFGAVMTFLTLKKKNPAGLGRVIRDNKGEVKAMVEEKDANFWQKKITEINCGLYLFDKKWLVENIGKVKKSAVTGEFYLVDLVKVAQKQNNKVETYRLANPSEWFGVNTPEELVLANQ